MPDYLVLHRQWAHDEIAPVTAEYELGLLGLLNPYLLVAVVQADSLDRVFQLTNHIDSEWWQAPQVLAYRQSRSTGVNDVVVEHDTGTCHLCLNAGWAQLTGVNIQFDLSQLDYSLTPRYRLAQIRLLALVRAE